MVVVPFVYIVEVSDLINGESSKTRAKIRSTNLSETKTDEPYRESPHSIILQAEERGIKKGSRQAKRGDQTAVY